MKIGFITCAADTLADYFPTLAEPLLIPTEPPFTPDDQIAVNELRKQGYEVEAIVWNSPTNTLSDFDLIVVRSPWDYKNDEATKSHFLYWIRGLEQAGLRVVNPVKFMQWNLDKHYLYDMGQQGVTVIPTQYFAAGSQLDLLTQFNLRGQFVLKPCISAAGIGLYHIKTANDAIQYQSEINARMQISSYMLQDFISEITSNGEWSLVFLGGKYSHALHKKPGPNSILVHAEQGGSLSFSMQPAKSIIDFANQAYKKILPAFKKATRTDFDASLLLYLRLDIIDTINGPVLIECEGVEPELFFRAKPKSEAMFCHAIANIL